MQKVNLVILFRGTFTETDAVKLKDETLNFELELDLDLSSENTGNTRGISTPTPSPTPLPKKRALLVGINYVGTQYELNGCVNDVQSIKTWNARDTSDSGVLPKGGNN